jgi:hypothetical protein
LRYDVCKLFDCQSFAHVVAIETADGTNSLSQLTCEPPRSVRPFKSGSKTMSDELRAAIRALQDGDEAHVHSASAEIADTARREPCECAAELSRALLEELAGGALRTPRLLTLLGLTHEPVPECVPLCLDLLRALATMPSLVPSDAALGAAAIVARTRPRALLPDLAAMQAGSRATQDIDRDVVQALPLLLAISSMFLTICRTVQSPTWRAGCGAIVPCST